MVTLRHFRGEIEVEEAAFFVRELDLAGGLATLSDRTREPLDPTSLATSPIDGALLCRVKRELAPPHGLLARFDRGAHAELLAALEPEKGGFVLTLAGTKCRVDFGDVPP